MGKIRKNGRIKRAKITFCAFPVKAGDKQAKA
jgi:hypothetical protein